MGNPASMPIETAPPAAVGGTASAGPQRLALQTFGARFWLVDLSLTPTDGELAILSAEERSRSARFVFERHRHHFLLAHAAMRTILAAELGVEPAELEFVSGAHGKPALPDHPGIVFNMSHSDQLALVAVARDLPEGSEIGVDIEGLRDVSNLDDLAAVHFTALERAELARCEPESRHELFLSGWTRKEACLKAIGSGLSIAPATFECALAPIRTLTRIPDGTRTRTVEVESLDLGRGHLAAIAITVPAADR